MGSINDLFGNASEFIQGFIDVALDAFGGSLEVISGSLGGE